MAGAHVTHMLAYACALKHTYAHINTRRTNKSTWIHTYIHMKYQLILLVLSCQQCMNIFTVQTQECKTCKFQCLLDNLCAEKWGNNLNTHSKLKPQHEDPLSDCGPQVWLSIPTMRSTNTTSSAKPQPGYHCAIYVFYIPHSDPRLTKYFKRALYCASQNTHTNTHTCTHKDIHTCTYTHFLSPSPTHSPLGVKTLLGLIRIQANSVDKQSLW